MNDSQMQTIMSALDQLEIRLLNKMDKLVKDVSDLKINRIGVQDDISKLNTELKSVTEAISDIKSEQIDLTTSLREGVLNVKTMVEDTSKALSSVNDTINNDLNQSVSSLSLGIEQVTTAVGACDELVDDVRNKVSECKTNSIIFADSVESGAESVNTSFTSFTDQLANLKSLGSELSNKLEEIRQTENLLGESTNELSERVSNDLNQSVSNLSLRIEQATTAVEACDELVNDVQNKVSECKTNSIILAESVESGAKSVNTSFTSFVDQLANLKSFSSELSNKLEEIQKNENLLTEITNELSEQVSSLTAHSSENVDRVVSLKGTIELCSDMIPKIIEIQNSMINTWSRFIANSEGYNTLYELMVTIQGKIATSYESFIELATKATGTNYELNASLGNVTEAMKQVNDSITEISQAVILLKDFYPNLLESQHVCEHFAAIVPSQEKFVQLLETMTDKKIANLSTSEKVEFGNMIARSVSSLCDMVNTTKVVKEGGSW